MKEGEGLIIMGIISLMLLILIILGHFGRKKSTKEKFIFTQKMKNINWKKTLKYWIFIQGVILFGSVGNNNMYWHEIIGIPLLIMSIIFVNALSMSNTAKEYTEMLKTNEFEDFEKIEKRNQKLKKILKSKSIF